MSLRFLLKIIIKAILANKLMLIYSTYVLVLFVFSYNLTIFTEIMTFVSNEEAKLQIGREQIIKIDYNQTIFT